MPTRAKLAGSAASAPAGGRPRERAAQPPSAGPGPGPGESDPTRLTGESATPRSGARHTHDYLRLLGVPEIPAATTPFDPGVDPRTVEAHLEQSAHRMASLKISMACWMVADEAATRRKVSTARRLGVATVTGGGPFEIAASQKVLPAYLDLCADIGFERVECGEGFTELELTPERVARMVHERGLGLEFELGGKHSGPFDAQEVDGLVELGRRWLGVGARALVVEGRESARDVGLFGEDGTANLSYAERFVEAFGFEQVIFEAPTKQSQFTLLRHFGSDVRLANVRLDELLRVEIYRYGLHSDAFAHAPWRVGSRDD
jgi:phosphosulfolactate synthase